MGSSELVVVLAALILMFYGAYRTRSARKKIKEQANRDFHEKLNRDQLESRLSESELMYENLEIDYWIMVSLFVGVCTYLYWHVWYISVPATIGLAWLGTQYFAAKPFSTGIPDDDT
jgi:hypothetical protein